MGTRINFKRPDGKQAAGYLAKAARAKAPGVVVIQEWWGLQDQIKGICDRFALAGYEALAPDLYAGTVVPYHDTEAAGREMNSLNFLDATDQVVRGAAVCFYGLPPDTVAKPADVKVPLQAHFANRDDWCTPAAVDAFEAGLKAAGKKAEIFRYDADHAFVNEQRDVHDRAAAELAWERTLAFWATHLGAR